MTNYNNINNARELFRAITNELLSNNILFDMPEKFGILAEGNGLGGFEISVMSPRELEMYSNLERDDMEGYGWAFCNDLEEIMDYARNYFWVESVLSGEHSTERV